MNKFSKNKKRKKEEKLKKSVEFPNFQWIFNSNLVFEQKHSRLFPCREPLSTNRFNLQSFMGIFVHTFKKSGKKTTFKNFLVYN